MTLCHRNPLKTVVSRFVQGSVAAASLLLCIYLFGCASNGDSSSFSDSARKTPANASSTRSPANAAATPTLALIEGRAVTINDLAPVLLDIAGTEALAEVILDMRLAERARLANVAVTDNDIKAERTRLLATLSNDPDEAVRLLRILQQRQGLSPQRLESLLSRNALLRALVADEIVVSDAVVRDTHEVLHGERRLARIITTDSMEAAERIRRLATDDSGEFASLALEHSTDRSSAQGGLLPPISRADASYPLVIREAIFALQPGQTSAVMMLEQGFAVLLLESSIPPDGTLFNDNDASLRAIARQSIERVEMERLARQLVDDADVRVFDAALERVWSQRGQ
ncbi:MAG: peptidylprolyl isomerase [Phycisphaerales bacterium]